MSRHQKVMALAAAAVMLLVMLPDLAAATGGMANDPIEGTEWLDGDVLNGVTVRFHPVEYHAETSKYTRYITSLCIRDNGHGLGQNAVHLYKIGDSSRFVLTKADDYSYYIDFFDGADDYSVSNKRFDISDNDSYYHEGNAVHVVKGNETAENKRWQIFRSNRGTYYIRNKLSLLYWDLEDSGYDNSNKLVQRSREQAQEWEMEIVAADDSSSYTPTGGPRTKELKQNYDSYTFQIDGKNVTGCNWMSFLPDDMVLSDVTIPGVHDAAAVHCTDSINSSAQTQQLSIYDMLRNGIRYYDIRLGPETNRKEPFLVHGGLASCYYKDQKLPFLTVLGWVEDFLAQNPGETVILQIKNDRGGDDLIENAMVFLRQWIFGTGSYGGPRTNRVYMGDHVPTLEECRGKIVILSRIDKQSNADYTPYNDGIQWALDAHDWEAWSEDKSDPLELTCSGDNYEVWTQDKHTKVGDSKWELIQNSIFNTSTGAAAKRLAAKARGKYAWVVSYTSCVSMVAPVKYPQAAAREQNEWLKNELMNNNNVQAGQYLGVVCSDFSDQQLAYLVYRQNFIIGTSYVTVRGIDIDGTEPFEPLVLSVSTPNKPLQEALDLEYIRTYFTKDNYVPYGGSAGTALLYRVPMTRVSSADGYAPYAADLQSLHGYDEPTLYVALQEPVYSGTNNHYLTMEAQQPSCGTAVTGEGSDQRPVPQVSLNSNPEYFHIAAEDGRTAAYWYDGDVNGWFTGLMEPGKTYGCRVVFEANWGYYFRPNQILTRMSCGGKESQTGYASVSEDRRKLTSYSKIITVRHQLQHVDKAEPTCTAEGMEEHYYCTGCGRYFRTEDKTEVTKDSLIIPALGHDWQDWTTDGAPAGQEVSVCGTDPSHKRFRDLVPTHTHGLTHIGAKEATCEEPGNMEYWVCDQGQEACGKYFHDANGQAEISAEAVIIPALGHLWGTPEYTWAEDDSQVTARRVCLRDFRHVDSQNVPAVDSGTPATCEADGTKVLTAEFADPLETQTKTVSIPALGHDWDQGEVTEAATCTEPGTRTFTCRRDPSHTRPEVIPASGHDPEIRYIFEMPDCTQGGFQTTETYCGICDEVLSSVREKLGPLEHNWGDTTYTWAEDNSSVTAIHVCDRCHQEERETKPTTSVADPAPTCETGGVLTWYSDPFDHHPYFVIQEKREEVPATGHEWGPWEISETRHRHVCLKDESHTQTAEHQWGPGSVTEKASTDQPGILSYACTECGFVRTEPIPVMRITPPAAVNGLVYLGSAQALITAGTAVGGTMQYAVGESAAAAPASGWSAGIPSGTDAGIYHVWYKAVGDEYHHDSEPACVTVTIRGIISATVTFKVANGSWNDETTTDKIVTLTGCEGDTLKLTADQIPAVGSKPGTNCKAGSWDETPSTETAITAATTYTYTYVQKDGISQTVTFRVEHGFWDDGTADDKTVTLIGYAGDTLTLKADQIPDVGGRPAANYQAGSWDTAPGTDTAITAPVTYTYTYEAAVFYTTVSGDGQTYRIGSNRDPIFTVRRSVDDELAFPHFRSAALDGQTLSAGDYETAQGSLIFTLKAAKAETLSLGQHTLTFTFTDGTASAAFTVRPVEGSFEDIAKPGKSFTFKKVWEGGSEKSIDFTLYKLGGAVYHHGFDKKIISGTEWRYDAWFSEPLACYVIEEPVEGYQTRYENVGVYAGITDRCCDGGTIVNYRVPRTGDEADLTLWLGCVLAGLTIMSFAVRSGKRKKARSK